MEIRAATYNDLGDIVAIYNQAVAAGFQTADTEPWSIERQQAWFDGHLLPAYPIYVAIEKGIVAGFATISPYRPGRGALALTKEISYYVHQSHLRQGIGIQLLQHAIQQAPAYRAHTLIAIVLDVNAPSITLLQKAGFALWGHLPGVADFNGTICGHLYYGLHLLKPKASTKA